MDDERRAQPRTRTAFFAVEVRGEEIAYRLVRDISARGFCVETVGPGDRPGERLVMEFPLPGSPAPIRVEGEVVHAGPDGVGVRIRSVDEEPYARLLAHSPPALTPAPR